MTLQDKIAMVQALTKTTDDTATITAFIDFAAKEIINWLYYNYEEPTIETVPAKYESVQIGAVVTGYNMIGAEGEKSHSEVGISRTFQYTDCIDYIRAHIIPITRLS